MDALRTLLAQLASVGIPAVLTDADLRGADLIDAKGGI